MLLLWQARAQTEADSLTMDSLRVIVVDSPLVKMDSIYVHGRSIVILGDSSLFVENDTILILPDSLAARLERDEQGRSEEFYRRLKQRFSKNRFSRELYNLIFTDPASDDKAGKPRPPGSTRYKQY